MTDMPWISPFPVPLISSFVGIVFLVSALTKLNDPRAFLRILMQYSLPRRVAADHLARAIPILEAGLAVGLLGWPVWPVRVPAMGAVLFLLAVSAAVGVRLAGGEREFACGCSEDLSRLHKAPVVLLRNAAFLGLLGLQLGLGDAVGLRGATVIAAYLTGCGAYLAMALATAAFSAFEMRNGWKVIG